MGQNISILIVDDEPNNLLVLSTILKQAGFQTIEASNGPECLQVLQMEKPDLVILDINMPGMDGFEVCMAIRKNDELVDVPVIFLTAMEGREHIIEGMRAGAIDYLFKPLIRDDILTRVRSVLESKNLLKEKMSLLRINQAMLDHIQNLLGDLSSVKAVESIKSSIAKESTTVLDHIDCVRKAINEDAKEQALQCLDQAEMSLQFADRVSQQLNEFAKVIVRVNTIMQAETDENGEMNLAAVESVMQASSDSVLSNKKVNQQEVDDLLDSLGI